MKKLLFSIVMLSMFGLALIGCRAEGEIDTNAQITAPR
jgi:hypothetical protein